jgi:chromosome segregation ATPase
MSVDIRRRLEDLRSLILTLEDRCSKYEAANQELKQQVSERDARIDALETMNHQLETKYQNLQAGMSTGSSAEEVERLKARFMTMVREIDKCIAKLEG